MKMALAMACAVMLSGCVRAPASPPPAPASSSVTGLSAFDPTPLHVAIWKMTADCLGFPPWDRPDVHSVSWATARAIITDYGVKAYGMTRVDDMREPVAIVLERDFWLYPTVVSHEIIHVLEGDPNHLGLIWSCELLSPVDLPLRPVG